jgi:hypothetical protein
LGEEGGVDEEVVGGIDGAIQIQVAVAVLALLGEEAGVDQEVIGGIDCAIEVHVAIPGVFHQDVVFADALAIEGGEDGLAGLVVEEDGQAGLFVGLGSGTGQAGAQPLAIGAAGGVDGGGEGGEGRGFGLGGGGEDQVVAA